jgi:hypothetical protein
MVANKDPDCGIEIVTPLIRRGKSAAGKHKFQGSFPVTLDWSPAGNAAKIALLLDLSARKSGAIAQLGERIVRNDEAVGSIPTSSTNYLNCLPTSVADFKGSLLPACATTGFYKPC